MTATEEAARAGFDLSLIELSLSYSYDKRAQQHQAALELALELERIGHDPRQTGRIGSHSRKAEIPSFSASPFSTLSSQSGCAA
jgi:hypothetical protein